MSQHWQRSWRMASATFAVAGLLAAGLIGNVSRVAAQEATPAASLSFGPATVSVTGHGEVGVAPDTAQITIGVDVIKPTLDEAQGEANSQATAVIDALKDAGIADEDIQTAYYSVNILRDYSENADPTKITGFEIMNQVLVTVHDTSKLGDLLDAAVQAGANSIYGVTFYVEDQTAAASEARTEAVQDAQKKAQELAEAAGMSLGPVVNISEGAPSYPGPVYGMGRGGGDMAAAQAAPVQPGSTIGAVDVSVTYELR